jgi:NAD(P)-dependent dehydrogenase (short-subunit alcohol dehydrogenase family)
MSHSLSSGTVLEVIAMSKVWFITGTSRGFGRVWAEAALGRGDRVAATARDPKSLDALVEKYGDRVLPLALDVTDRAAALAAVKAATEHFGRLDIVINNAGYGLFGTVEELQEEAVRAQVETNFFGSLWVTQAVLPVLRAQGSGHILQVSSIGGLATYPALGAYNATKWAVEGLAQSLAAEMAPFGIKVTIIEPGAFATDWYGSSTVYSPEHPAYAALHQAMGEQMAALVPIAGDPTATAEAVLTVVDLPEPPLRLLLGPGLLEQLRAEYAGRIETWERHAELSAASARRG